MEVAVYARVSTEGAQQAQTIQQQIERLQAHVTQQPNWHLAEDHIYRDDGYSGAQLNRPGLDHLRDHAGFAEFELVLITAPDRLARKYVHQVLIIEELQAAGCRVEFLERPMSDDPNDQLLLQIRGAVAEYERTLIAERMRRGRQAKLRSGRLLPWTRPPYGYVLDSEQPRDPNRVRLEPVQAAIIVQIFAWYTQADQRLSLYEVAMRLSESAIFSHLPGVCAGMWPRYAASCARQPIPVPPTAAVRTRRPHTTANPHYKPWAPARAPDQHRGVK